MDLPENLKLENLNLKLEIRKQRIQLLNLMLRDIQRELPLVIEEAEVLSIEIEKLSVRKLEAVK